MRNVEELINPCENGFELVQEWMKNAKNQIEILPADPEKAKDALFRTQVTTRSPMGAIIYETGGILINDGWLRILGSGHERLTRSLPEWNVGKSVFENGDRPSFLLIADDVLGGFFAINAGGLTDKDMGIVFYFAPDTMEWESTGNGYSEFIYWCFHGDLHLFYEYFYWDTYQEDLKSISGDQGFCFVPLLCTKEGREDINTTSRKPVPLQHLWDLYVG